MAPPNGADRDENRRDESGKEREPGGQRRWMFDSAHGVNVDTSLDNAFALVFAHNISY
jgi:hypothetical protein